MAEVRSHAAAAGRDPDALTLSIRMNVTLSGNPSARDIAPDAGVLTSALKDYEAAGVEHVCLAFDSGDVDLLASTMRMIAADVLPAFRPAQEA
jgi:hypothetical protein